MAYASNDAVVVDNRHHDKLAHHTRHGALSGFVALLNNALTVASSWGMAAMGGLGIFYSAFEYPNDGACNVKDFITPMMYLIVASSVEVGLAGLTIIPAVIDAMQGVKMARNRTHVPSAAMGTVSLIMQIVVFLALIFLAVWAGFGGWTFWHANQGCGPNDLYLFLWAFLITEMALVFFRLLTTTGAALAAIHQIVTGRRVARDEELVAEKPGMEYNNVNGNNHYNYTETAPASPVPVAHSNYAAGTNYAAEPGFVQNHVIQVDPNTTRAY